VHLLGSIVVLNENLPNPDLPMRLNDVAYHTGSYRGCLCKIVPRSTHCSIHTQGTEECEAEQPSRVRKCAPSHSGLAFDETFCVRQAITYVQCR
jgi:hypothetical protein